MTLLSASVFTIGHSSHSIDEFVALLKGARISAVADVRSTPYSKWRPHFSREALQMSLAESDIAYVFLGVELGGRGSDHSSRDEQGRVQYRRIAESASFREGLCRVRAGSERMRLALMCAEREPLECHRGLLISRHLIASGTTVLHIHSDGEVESHHDAENRLLRLVGLCEPDLFRTEEQRLAEAYERQEAHVAYVLPTATSQDRPAS